MKKAEGRTGETYWNRSQSRSVTGIYKKKGTSTINKFMSFPGGVS